MTAAVKIARRESGGNDFPPERIDLDGKRYRAKVKRQDAADSTLEALMYSLRGGAKVLTRPDVAGCTN